MGTADEGEPIRLNILCFTINMKKHFNILTDANTLVSLGLTGELVMSGKTNNKPLPQGKTRELTMRAKIFATGLVLVLALSVAGVQAWAQKLKVNIPFDFVAGDQEFPAGSYQIKYENGLQKHLILRSMDDSDLSTNIMYITRLSEREGGEPCLVFDKAADKAYLSEVYLVGMDGFHLQGAPGKHTHQKVAGTK